MTLTHGSAGSQLTLSTSDFAAIRFTSKSRVAIVVVGLRTRRYEGGV
jgi:hypothetical protein